MVTFMHAGFYVADFDAWKKGFDASTAQRKMAGEVSYQVLRDTQDPNHLTVVSVLNTPALVSAFMNSPTFEGAMKASGVIQMGEVLLMEEADSGAH
ncbi:antibiotic biosynthesis monooxygenase [Candidatus Bipolaricaulota bacterium]|nr:antibiotic biosynthesis monooxygenase [Candidatus Bipolaricaulota bacterium]